jgi:omega-hydroxy-beta-dihydromenaquinone-9 sulfotransferase
MAGLSPSRNFIVTPQTVMKRRLRLSLGAWQRLAPKVDRERSKLKLRSSLAYWLSGVVYSLLFRLQNASHADVLKAAVPPPPVFVLGFWRSGTTLLHELLCQDPQFGFPSTYACMNPSHFVLTEAWVSGHKAREQTTRPMDNMSYSWVSPQEDEFALLALGAPSPYESLIVPSLMRDPKILVDLRQRSSAEQKVWGEALRCFLLLLTIQQRKTMVFKSPPHGFKLPLLLSMFPRARYIVIERNPYEVFVSNLKLWRMLINQYAVESSSSDEIEQFVLAAYLMHEDAIAEGKSRMDANRLACVRYEALTADPIGEMERLYRELEISNFEQARAPLEKYVAGAAGYARNHFAISPAQKLRVEDSWGSVIRAKGYAWPDQYLSLAS